MQASLRRQKAREETEKRKRERERVITVSQSLTGIRSLASATAGVRRATTGTTTRR